MSATAIEYGGLHHLALVCRDMERTVDFYTNVLGMKLKKGFDLDRGKWRRAIASFAEQDATERADGELMRITGAILDAREPFLAACARTAQSLGTGRPLSAYLADLERQIGVSEVATQCDRVRNI